MGPRKEKSMMGKTASSVQSESQMLAQRRQASIRDKSGMNALNAYAHLCIGFSLYLYGHASTPGYLSTLLAVPPLLLFFLLGRFLVRRKKMGLSVTASAAGPGGAKFFDLCFFLLHLLDAQLALFALCAVVIDAMPDFGRLSAALSAALFCALGYGEDESLYRLSRPLKWLIGALLLYCGIAAVPHGKASHFFPLSGGGAASIIQGAVWMTGAVSSGIWPLLTHEEKEPSGSFFSAVRPSLAAVGLGIATYLAAVWLMPYYTMKRPESTGWRMLLLVHMTPSVPAWSMEVIGLLLLLLAAVTYSASQAAFALSRFGGKQKKPRCLTALLLFLLVPGSVIDPDGACEMLTAAAAWRAPAYFALLVLLCLCSLIRNKGKQDVRKGIQ